MKKLLSTLLAAMMLLSLAACSSSGAPSDKSNASTEPVDSTGTEVKEPAETSGSKELVIYTADSQSNLDAYIPALEEETGIHVEIVSAGTVQIIKGCKNLENTKLFVDYMTSYEQQMRAGETIQARGTRSDVPVPAGLEDIFNAKIMVEDVHHTLENTQNYLDRFKDLYTS